MNPLSHHEIVRLVEPFAKQGRHVDLKASNRLERRLVFKSIDHPAGAIAPQALTERLVLEGHADGSFCLTRTLIDGRGLAATLSAAGRDPNSLLQRIDRVSPSRHFQDTSGVAIVLSYRLAPSILGSEGSASGDQPLLTKAMIVRDSVSAGLDFNPLNDRRVPLEIRTKDESVSTLPTDFLALLGPAWDRIERDFKGWRGRLYIPKAEPARTAFGERKVTEMAVHLADALALSPGQFHRRYLRARRQVLLRGVLTMLAVVVAMAIAPLLLTLAPNQPLVTTLASFWFPVVVFSLPIIASRRTFITPSWPRPLPATAWRPRPLKDAATAPSDTSMPAANEGGA